MLLLGLMLHFMLLKDANTGLLTFVVYRDLFTMQMLTQEVWRGARPPQKSASLTSCQGTLMLLVQRPQSEQQRFRGLEIRGAVSVHL